MIDRVPNTFGKFSAQAKTILLAAQRYAETTKVSLGSEHLLIALAVTPDTAAYQVLRRVPITPDQIRLALAMHVPAPSLSDGMRLEAKAVLERAAFQASVLGAPTITPECLLWSLVADTQCTAHALVTQIGVEPKSVRKTLERQFLDDQGAADLSHDIEILGLVGPDSFPPGIIPEQPPIEHDHEHTHADEHDTSEAVPTHDEPPSQTPILDDFAVDLTMLAAENELDPIIGRSAELERVQHILGRKTKNNPLLLGEPGVGKTAIVLGLAQAIVSKHVPEYLQGMRLFSLELGQLIAGTMYRGQFEERLRRLVAELEANEDVILFLDEIHTLVGAGNSEGSLDAANILKPALSQGRIQIIGATTTAEYSRQIEKDPALERRFQTVFVAEPTKDETKAILQGLAPRYADFHAVTISDEVIDESITLADRYLHDRQFPDKAIDLLDEAAAARKAARKSLATKRPSRFELERQLKELRSQKEYELHQGNVERAAYLRKQEGELKLAAQRASHQVQHHDTKRAALTPDDLRTIISRWTGIPVTRLQASDRKSLLGLEDRLKSRIIGQPEPVSAIAAAIRRSRTGITRGIRPLAAFLLVGPTGVGKTETARVLAEEIFGDRTALLKLDMSEYMERHQVARLIGAPPGYVGHENSTPLVETVRRRPHQVLLLDEIEKAHPDIANVLLQVLEDGELTDGKGRTVTFRHTIILMTSNLGGDLWQSGGGLGFSSDRAATPWWEAPLQDQLRAHFRPEFLGRLDGVLTYHPLSYDHLITIAQLAINDIVSHVQTQGMELVIDPALEQYLAKIAQTGKEGARAIRRLVTTELATKLGDAKLRSPNALTFTVSVHDQTIVVKRAPAKKSTARHATRSIVRTT